MGKPQTILLVDDHAVVREGVRRLLLDLPDVTVLEAGNGAAALAMFVRKPFDIVLIDLSLPGIGGLELLQRMLKERPRARIIIFSMHSEPLYAARAMRLGAKGYVSKSAASDELMSAIRHVAEGRQYIERDIARQLAAATYSGDDPLKALTIREIDILRMLGDGRSIAQIAEEFGVSYKTIANTCSIMKTKLGLERTVDLIRASISLFKS